MDEAGMMEWNMASYVAGQIEFDVFILDGLHCN
jgi:hypothetical protein